MRPRPRRRAPLLLAAAFLTGCAAARVQPPVSALVRPDAWESRGGATTRFSSSPAALSGWWSGLGDPTLTGLVERALVASPDVRNARAKVREARARHGLARADYLPSIDASVGFSSSRTGRADATNLFDAGFDASWEPDLWGGTRSAVRAARLELEASEADLDAARVTLAAEVARNYVELRGYQTRLEVARQNLASQTETLQLTSWRAQAGLVSTLDVEQARTNVEETRATVPDLETSRAAAEHRIAVLIGLSPGSLRHELSAPAPVLAVPHAIAVGIPADALRRRPDVRASEFRIAAATAREGQARAALYPALRLSGSLTVEAATLGGLGAADSLVRSLVASLTAPLFDRAKLRREIDVKNAQAEQALASWESTILSALEEVENALVALASSEERGEAFSTAAESARNAARMARDRYAAGLIGYQVVLETERSLLSVEDSRISSRVDSATALIRLYKSLGGGWEPAAASRQTSGDAS